MHTSTAIIQQARQPCNGEVFGPNERQIRFLDNDGLEVRACVRAWVGGWGLPRRIRKLRFRSPIPPPQMRADCICGSYLSESDCEAAPKYFCLLGTFLAEL